MTSQTVYQIWIIGTLLSLLCWAALFQTITGDSRQTCNEVTSVDTCEWELR